ncbi:Multidomain esterase [Lachnellula occidentalis]|uniref:Multidomain esterase n=1 Tax=Lachnellula occidentalis TaxID=215460 RepID=A0A8H8S0L5_9HELO|nr:Multidomain esterase [Lachnellula occidentalis]
MELSNLLQMLGRILGLLGSLTPDADSQAKLKIMPLGDSITANTCWRTLLWDNLRDAGVTPGIQFVGSSSSDAGACVGTGTWDHHHEGHGGYTAVDIADNNLVGWLDAARPDVVVFMLGTNDVTHGRATSAIIAAYTKMVGEMRGSNPSMKIIVDLVIPLSGAGNSGVVALNAAILPWAKSLNSTDSPIYIADTNTGFTDRDLADGVHPNSDGDRKIAGRLYPILLQIINENREASNAVEYLLGHLDGDLDGDVDGDVDGDLDGDGNIYGADYGII